MNARQARTASTEPAIPRAVRRAALFPELELPDPPPGYPARAVRGDDYIVMLSPRALFASVAVRAFPPDAVEARVAEIRALLAREGFEQAAWLVPERADPPALASRLCELGMRPWDEGRGVDALAASMLLVTEPPAGPPAVEVRPARTFVEFCASDRVFEEAFELSVNDRRALEAGEREAWEWTRRWPTARRFVALLDGEVIGFGGVVFCEHAVYLAGGGVRPELRGRGIYRALVRARWDAAVEHGTPALTVSAGSMSRPILQRLGFLTVGVADCLSDRFRSAEARGLM